MHLLDDHKINEVNEAIRIAADERDPSNGNASHEYRVSWPSSGPPRPNDTPKADGCDLLVRFQHGPLGETGPNGVTNEALLAIVADRLRGFQDGPYGCRENAYALDAIEAALEKLHERTMRRVTAGVEGTSAVMEGEGQPEAAAETAGQPEQPTPATQQAAAETAATPIVQTSVFPSSTSEVLTPDVPSAFGQVADVSAAADKS